MLSTSAVVSSRMPRSAVCVMLRPILHRVTSRQQPGTVQGPVFLTLDCRLAATASNQEISTAPASRVVDIYDVGVALLEVTGVQPLGVGEGGRMSVFF